MIVLDPNIPNQEELVLRLLSKVLLNPIKYGEEVCGLLIDRREELQSVITIDDIHAISPMVCAFLIGQVEEKHLLKVQDKKAKFINKGLNRTEYQPTGLLEHRETVAKDKVTKIRRWKGTIGIKCCGLLDRMTTNLYGEQAEPSVISVLNSLPFDEVTGSAHEPIAPFHWDNMRSMGVAVSGERMAVQMNSPGWAMVMRAFPLAIDARSYIHGLGAPLIQGGYLASVKCVLRNLHVCKPVDTLMVDALGGAMRELGIESEKSAVDKRTYELIPAEDDGSGRYHPKAESVAHLVAKYGPVAMQIRAMDPRTGLFTKGILVPDETSLDSDGAPTITFSWKQVKGKWKDEALRRAENGEVIERNLHVGVLRTWDRKRSMVGCFELLENIAAVQRPNETDCELEARKEQIREDINSLVDDAMIDLGKDGIEGLLASIGKDDKMLSLVIKLLAKAKSLGINIDPTSIDRVKRAMNTKLRNRLWSIAQGAGIEGRQLVIVNDASLERGECVVAHYKIGTSLATWRFPIVLSQALLTLKTVLPRPHQMIEGKVIEQVIYMNPTDVLDVQGDDDGDIVACTPDPRVVRLFSNKLDDRRFAIEPKGVKLKHKTDSAKGLDYLCTSPMGPVGLMTMNRAKLLAVGDIMGALAMSVLVQEAIDKAKRFVRWTDWEKACVLTNWTFVDGVYHIHAQDTDHNFMDQRADYNGDGELPQKQVLKWVSERLRMFGCDTKARQYPLGWRKNVGEEEKWTGETVVKEIAKQIDGSMWELSRESQNGYEGGNLVHEAYDRAWLGWQEQSSNFQSHGEKGDVSSLLLRLLAEEGYQYTSPAVDWQEYMNIKDLSGLGEFAENMKLAMKHDPTMEDGSDNKDRYQKINEAYVLLHQQLKEYVDGNKELGIAGEGISGLINIWCMETTPWFRVDGGNGPKSAWYTNDFSEIPKGSKFSRVNNTNHAINAVCWPGSPVMDLLGINGQDTCGYLTPPRLKRAVEWVMKQENAFSALSNIIWKQTAKDEKPGEHEQVTGVPIHACECCRDVLQTAVVRRFRAAKKRKETVFLGRMCSELNFQDRTTVGKVDWKRLGVNVAELLSMSDQELVEMKMEMSEQEDQISKSTLKAITLLLNGEGIG